MVKVTADGRVKLDPFGTVKGGASRATALVQLQTIPGGEGFVVSLIAASAGVTHVWIGASLIKEIAVEDFPVTVLWSEVTTGSGASVKLRGGAQGQPPSWWQDGSRGSYAPEPPEPNDPIPDVDMRVGDAALVFSVMPFFPAGASGFSASIDGEALPAGSSLTSPEGVMTLDPLLARGDSNVTVIATYAAGVTVTQTFRLIFRAGAVIEPPLKLGDPPSVIVDESETGTISIDFGAFVTASTDLVWTVEAIGAGASLPDGAGISDTGVFTAPKTAVWPTTTIEATASNAQNGTGGEVALSSAFAVQAVVVAALAWTAEPRFGVKAGSFAATGGVLTFTGIAFEGGTAPHTVTTRLYRSAAAVGAYRAAGVLDYTLVLADEGDAMTGSVLVTDSLGAQIEFFCDEEVAIPVQPTVGDVPPPTVAMLTASMGKATLIYNFAGYSQQPAPYNAYQSTVVNNKGGVFYPQIVALAAFLGMTNVIGGNTPAQKTAANLTAWVTNRAPAARGGVGTQADQPFAICAMLGKRTPAVWNLITAANRTRIDRVMEGLLVSSAFCNSDNNPWVKGGNSSLERTITGAQYGRGRVPNFVTMNVLMPAVVNDYMGGGLAAESFLKTFNRANFAAAITAAGGVGAGGPMRELLDTFSQNWDIGAGNYNNVVPHRGPTAAELHTTVGRGPDSATQTYRQFGLQIHQYVPAVSGQIKKVFGALIRAGANVPASANIPAYMQRTADGIGMIEPVAGPNKPGRGRRVAALTIDLRTVAEGRTEAITGQQAWNSGMHPYGGPNAAVLLEGKLTELDTRDGGSGGAGTAGPRASMKYASEGMTIILPALAAMAARGMINPNDSGITGMIGNMHRGMADWEFCNLYGFENYAKGGYHGAGDGTSGPWFWKQALALGQDVLAGIYTFMIQDWAGWPRNTVLPVITGTAKVGQTLTLPTGIWLGSPTFTRKWQRFTGGVWTDIPGATGATYTPVVADVGNPLRGFVFGTNAKGQVLAIAAQTAAVAAA